MSHAKQITWIVIDFAPYYILADRLEGQGRDELLIQLIQQYMPDYTFNYKLYPASRAIHELSNVNNQYCVISLYKTADRQQHIAFSDEYSTIGLSTSVALRKDVAHALGVKDKAINLASLVTKHKLNVGIAANRSFGDELDTLLTNLPNKQVSIRPGRDALASLTVMLIKKRVDVILGYPSEHYYHKLHVDKLDELTQVRLDLTSQITTGFAGCSKNAKGQEDAAAISLALGNVHKDERYRLTMSRWLPEQFRPQLASVFNK
ncbi:transporter substrate-binding domain-containing protein [Pseudoalteromonas sp. McH1-7]|uniref:Solute-binding protein family 3/N-terminal domain-containing protein n=1 Tax=Pseudoalteromonas peptidolytica F12-50-A1 TaxID=1315280 RepID=A0A8I0MUR3_9GAMM|nr:MULTISPECIES: transporter substrate-binding domain-containing protein [Pseudoalteromonas]MBE0346224.1 hypothetical protein [Pseudoalteromonas peptidolytica F12-50-A1]MDW7548302.1 transporter substrate-binding domain-containing protein [Pseudoalteromonas peptidolytica]NLR14140.1 transporter substrate-binding domain-containing protein [Pseudoalteromonas peptidolytica]NUZ10405.1 transporter substrate-binding domain-containing protein [Pseudoalteromonas sp. McH1-7]USD27148.1 transporter substra